MRTAFYLLPSSAVLGEALLLWRLSKQRQSSRYPYLTAYVVYDLLCNLALFPTSVYKPNWFATFFWRQEMIALFLRFLLNWEFFRGLFGQWSTLRALTWRALLMVELGVLPTLLMLSWVQAPMLEGLRMHLWPVVEQYVSLAQAFLLLTPAAVASYYRLPLGRNLRGLCMGYGIYLFARSVDFASLQAFRGFAPYWQILTPVMFIGMTVVWLWAFWEYAPSSQRADLNEAQCASSEMEWRFLWDRAMMRLRRGIRS